ncbi:MAG: hypothetical protein ACYCYF_02695 [Anaerolineae bacterium]
MESSRKWFQVRVTDLSTGKTRAKVNMPMSLVSFGMKMAARFAPEAIEGVDLSEVMEAMRAEEPGKILEVEDEEHGERVEISVA